MDSILHIFGGFAIFGAPLLWWPLAFPAGAIFGALRELSQHSRLGLLDDRAWKETFSRPGGDVRWHRVWEAASWGVGAFLAALVWRSC